MPLYSYRCTACSAEFELLVTSSEVPVCPACGGEQLDRLIGSTAPQGKSADLAKRARSHAARAGHLSNFGGGKGR